MKTVDFDYDLPPERIAQTPIEPRHASRMLVLNRALDTIDHAIFVNLGQYLQPEDVLVLNQTRVIPARLFAHKTTGGKVEILLLRRQDAFTWEALVGGKGLGVGKQLQVEGGGQAQILSVLNGPRRLIRFDQPPESCFERIGHVPLPPYIHEPLADPERYQTVYARQPGSAAAPTAGLHFTSDLILALQAQGIRLAQVTLHVGLDTFAPVTEERPDQHVIHSEWCQVTPETAEIVNQARARGGRVIAVGTTSVRVLESAASTQGLQPFEGNTSLFILPGYSFQIVDAMITNFHLPRSSLIMLVSAFAGRERILDAYRLAIQQGYRFYSFGDAMLIL